MTDPGVVARHEAAHICIAHALGIQVRHATIDPRRPRVSTRCRTDELAKDERFALIDLAGVCTEQQIRPARTDVKNAMRRCRKIAMDQAGTDTMTPALEIEAAILFAQLGVRAAELVDSNREMIDRVAGALLEHGELDGDAIDHIMGDCR